MPLRRIPPIAHARHWVPSQPRRLGLIIGVNDRADDPEDDDARVRDAEKRRRAPGEPSSPGVSRARVTRAD